MTLMMINQTQTMKERNVSEILVARLHNNAGEWASSKEIGMFAPEALSVELLVCSQGR